MQPENKIYASLTALTGWLGKHWYKVRIALCGAWIMLSIIQWVFLRITNEWFLSLYWLTREVQDVAASVLIIFLLLENWIIRIQVKKQQ